MLKFFLCALMWDFNSDIISTFGDKRIANHIFSDGKNHISIVT